MVLWGTEDSTKTALILCSAMKAASVLMSEVPASLAVLIPWMPLTSNP